MVLLQLLEGSSFFQNKYARIRKPLKVKELWKNWNQDKNHQRIAKNS